MNESWQVLIEALHADIKELIKLCAVHNELLRTHEARSLTLQKEQEMLRAELAPIKSHVRLVDIILKGMGLVTVGVAIQYLVRHLLSG